MADCPLADECPSFQERIQGMGCQHYGDRGGMEWCNHYSQPISELKTAPVVPGQEVVVDISDMHESGAGVGHQEESGFVIMVDGVLPPARVKAKVNTVKPNYARADFIEKVETEPEEDDDDEGDEASGEGGDDEESERKSAAEKRPHLGSRDNFWGG